MTNLIPDINLKTVINNYLSRDYEKDITKSDLESIKGYIYSDISSMGKYICSMEGLQYATNMTELLIENNLITNMNQLINLNKLNTLFLNRADRQGRSRRLRPGQLRVSRRGNGGDAGYV